MINEKFKQTCQRALDVFTFPEQREMMLEEMNELGLTLQHHRRGRIAAAAVVEEIADVMIVAYQMAIAFGVDNVQDMIDYKLDRLNKRIDKRLKSMEQENEQGEIAKKDREEFFGTPIEAYSKQFSVRIMNCFRVAGIHTVGDLANMRPYDMYKWRNFGKRSWQTVVDFCENHNIKLQNL